MKRKINIGILAHVDAGKTSLTEQLLFCGGALRSAGAVDLGTAQTDTLQVEQARGISVKTADAVLETETAVVNLIDTPGHADFISEVERALSVLDCAVLVVSAVEGVQAQTEILLDAVQRLALPCVVFVNKLDRAGSDFAGACAALSDLLADRTLLVVNRPAGEGAAEASVVPEASCLENAVMLAADEALLERYLAGEEVDFAQTVCAAVENGAVPVLCGSSKTGAGCKLCSISSAPACRLRRRAAGNFWPACSAWSTTGASASSRMCASFRAASSRGRAFTCPGAAWRKRSRASAGRSAGSRRTCRRPRPATSRCCSALATCAPATSSGAARCRARSARSPCRC